LSVTVACAELLQPFALFVTVTVYDPLTDTVGFCAADVKPSGPDQL